ncbi:Mur ligase family protein [Arcanobacterium hippocoleae]|uniref:Mur ligase family protein n=1 Tax=Arcanobacterium hippocoleae TaxID=149017 RepID=UPI0033405F00
MGTQNTCQLSQLVQEIQHAQLLVDTCNYDAQHEIQIADITFDSRKVFPGALFICKGANFKVEYLLNAIAAGAVAYLSETRYDVPIPGIITSNTRLAMAVAARKFFAYPDQKLHLIGVTGTKGKSTTVYMVKAVLDAALAASGKAPCGLLSGIEIFDGATTKEAHLTTEESVELLRILAECVKNGVTHCVIEVSSQALKYGRVAGIEFDICSFANIGFDHISPVEHPDFADYLESKLKIAEQTKDFIYSLEMDQLTAVEAKVNAIGVHAHTISGADGNRGEFVISDILAGSSGAKFQLNGHPYEITMPGTYNVENAAVAIACGLISGVTPEDIAAGLRDVAVPGRSELLSTADGKIHFFVDYAHNALSFEKALQSLHELYPAAKIITLFGAPGNKAYNRRIDLPQVAEKYSEAIYIIPEDTGTEDVQKIAYEVVQNIQTSIRTEIYDDREAGIQIAFQKELDLLKEGAQRELVFFVAGKGRENFMKVNGGYEPYIGDHRVAQDLIRAYASKK